jgi:hypothetical protein
MSWWRNSETLPDIVVSLLQPGDWEVSPNSLLCLLSQHCVLTCCQAAADAALHLLLLGTRAH